MNKYVVLVQNIALFALNAIATKLITFILIPLYTSYMSAGEYGLTDMSVTVINLLTPMLTLDIAEGVVRFLVGDKKNSEQYIAVSFIFTAVSVILVGLATPILDFSVFGGLGDYKVLFVIAYTSSVVMNLCGEIARGKGMVRIIPISAAISSIIVLLSATYLIGYLGMGIAGYFISVSMGPFIGILIYIFAGNLVNDIVTGLIKLSRLDRRERQQLIKPMLIYSLPLIPNALFWWLSNGVSRIYITGMIGIAASGLFAAASKIPNILNTVYVIFQQAWQLSAFQEAQKKDLDRFFTNIFTILQFCIILLCTIMMCFLPAISSLFLKGETFQAWPMISLLLLSNLFNIFSTFYGTIYTSTLHTSFIMKTTVVGALSCAILTPLLISIIDLYGACVASIVGQLLVLILRMIDSNKYISIKLSLSSMVVITIILIIQAVCVIMQNNITNIITILCSVLIVLIEITYIRRELHNMKAGSESERSV